MGGLGKLRVDGKLKLGQAILVRAKIILFVSRFFLPTNQAELVGCLVRSISKTFQFNILAKGIVLGCGDRETSLKRHLTPGKLFGVSVRIIADDATLTNFA